MGWKLYGLIAAAWFAAAQSPQTVLDGVYTAEQVLKGEAGYEKHCVKCHEGNDPEGPTLMGRTFIDRWREDHLDVLFDFMKTRMPADAAGGLSDTEYLDILAFILHLNDYPEGGRPLQADLLSRIRLVGKEGPRPLPPNTLVKVVGCLTQDSAGEWVVSQSSEPIRSRNGRETTSEELKKSAAVPLGMQSFRVQNFANIRFDFKPDPLKGHRVQAKGALLRQASGERISLTSLESVAPSCQM